MKKYLLLIVLLARPLLAQPTNIVLDTDAIPTNTITTNTPVILDAPTAQALGELRARYLAKRFEDNKNHLRDLMQAADLRDLLSCDATISNYVATLPKERQWVVAGALFEERLQNIKTLDEERALYEQLKTAGITSTNWTPVQKLHYIP
jgi:hypothetical protein